MTCYLDVRDERPPHAVMGQVRAPYEASVGDVRVVRLAERLEWQGTAWRTHDLNVHKFVDAGRAVWAIAMSRERWEQLKGRLT